MTYDSTADAAYLSLADGPATRSDEVSPCIVLDFDSEGRLLGIEILHASKTLAAGAVAGLTAEQPMEMHE